MENGTPACCIFGSLALRAKAWTGLAPLWWRGIGSFGGQFFELRRACEVEAGMAPNGIVEPVDIAADGLVGFLAGVEDGSQTSSDFSDLKNISTIALS